MAAYSARSSGRYSSGVDPGGRSRNRCVQTLYAHTDATPVLEAERYRIRRHGRLLVHRFRRDRGRVRTRGAVYYARPDGSENSRGDRADGARPQARFLKAPSHARGTMKQVAVKCGFQTPPGFSASIRIWD